MNDNLGNTTTGPDNRGYIMAFSSYVIWGLLALYWKQIHHFAALEMLSIRIILSAVVLIIVISFITKKKVFIDYLKDSALRKKLLLSSLLIAVNWGVYVYAIAIGQVVQASLGYYINPLVSVALGVFVMKERLTMRQYVALFFALLGVLYMTIVYGQFPIISIVLAFSFGFYGLLKKQYHLDSLNSLLVEVIYLSPIMIVILMISGFSSGSNMSLAEPREILFLSFAGFITVLPLILFAEGAKRIPLSAIGFLQYIAPSMMLFTGVVLYNEAFTPAHGISFGLIWLGLGIYSSTLIKKKR